MAELKRKPKLEKHYFECMCGHAILSVYRDEWDEYTDYVALVVYGEHTPGWKDRLRHVWSILRYGEPWQSTEVLLRPKEADRLASLLRKENDEANRVT